MTYSFETSDFITKISCAFRDSFYGLGSTLRLFGDPPISACNSGFGFASFNSFELFVFTLFFEEFFFSLLFLNVLSEVKLVFTLIIELLFS